MSEASTQSPAAPEEDEIVDVPRRKRPKDDDEMDITPMIDITFLLLIFFLVASKIDDSASVPIPIAEYGSASAPIDAVIVTITENEGGLANVFLGEGSNPLTQVSGTDEDSQREEIAQYIEDEVNGDKEKKKFMIMAEKRVKQGDINRISQAVNDANANLTASGTGKISQILLAVKQEG